MSIIQPTYHFALLLVKAEDRAFSTHDNMALLDRVSGQRHFDGRLLDQVLRSPWNLESIYKRGEVPYQTPETGLMVNIWTAPGVKEASSGVTIVSGVKKLPDGRTAIMPHHVYIPQTLMGHRISASVTTSAGAKPTSFKVMGAMLGVSYSCCPGNESVNAHFVATDEHGNVYSQSRPSMAGEQTGVGNSFNEDGVIRMANAGTIHNIQHEMAKILGTGQHCAERLAFDVSTLNRGAAPPVFKP